MGIFGRKTQTKKIVRKRKSKSTKLDWGFAPDVKSDIEDIVSTLGMEHIRMDRVFFYRTEGSKARAYARTWMMPKIFQEALGVEPAYVIEVISKYYDPLPDAEQKEVLIHELLHIPKNFSGALVPHSGRNRHLHVDARKLTKEYLSKK